MKNRLYYFASIFLVFSLAAGAHAGPLRKVAASLDGKSVEPLLGKIVIVDADDKVWECSPDRENSWQELTELSGQRVIDVISEGYHFVALTADGRVFVWGDNTFGQLGLGDNQDRKRPVQLKFPNEKTVVSQIACGKLCSCALANDGTILTWGWHRNFHRNRIGISIVEGFKALDISIVRDKIYAVGEDGNTYLVESGISPILPNEVIFSGGGFPLSENGNQDVLYLSGHGNIKVSHSGKIFRKSGNDWIELDRMIRPARWIPESHQHFGACSRARVFAFVLCLKRISKCLSYRVPKYVVWIILGLAENDVYPALHSLQATARKRKIMQEHEIRIMSHILYDRATLHEDGRNAMPLATIVDDQEDTEVVDSTD